MAARRFQLSATPCGYLPDETSTMEYEFASHLTAAEYEQRMNAGWRKFGMLLFHPVCRSCSACRSLRVLVDKFRPDRSQMRAWKRNADMRVQLASPSVDDRRLDLYRRYHRAQAERKGWQSELIDAEEYAERFIYNSVPAVEISVWEGEDLCGIALTELTPNAVSAVYHYHDPDKRGRSLGTFIVLQILEMAKRLGVPFVHLGYYAAGCGSLEYKARFRPCEARDAAGQWRSVDFPVDGSVSELGQMPVDL